MIAAISGKRKREVGLVITAKESWLTSILLLLLLLFIYLFILFF